MSDITATGELQLLSKERVWQETFRALATPDPQIYFTSLFYIGALDEIAPDLANALKNEEIMLLLPSLKKIKTAEHRYVTLMFFTSLNDQTKAFEKINASFAAPNSLTKLAHLVCSCYPVAMQALTINSVKILDLLKKTDALRNAEKSMEVFTCMRAAHQLVYSSDTPALDFLISVIPKLNAYKLNQDVQEKLSGKEIGDELSKQHCKIIDESRQSYK
jgi:tRNA nucleotidyltransferase (CCA-adding enzyme)